MANLVNLAQNSSVFEFRSQRHLSKVINRNQNYQMFQTNCLVRSPDKPSACPGKHFWYKKNRKYVKTFQGVRAENFWIRAKTCWRVVKTAFYASRGKFRGRFSVEKSSCLFKP